MPASMGPQPWELRKHAPRSKAHTSNILGFNGAAALGAAETALALHAVKTVGCEDLCESPSPGALPHSTGAQSEIAIG